MVVDEVDLAEVQPDRLDVDQRLRVAHRGFVDVVELQPSPGRAGRRQWLACRAQPTRKGGYSLPVGRLLRNFWWSRGLGPVMRPRREATT